jgi:hypothetical protein
MVLLRREVKEGSVKDQSGIMARLLPLSRPRRQPSVRFEAVTRRTRRQPDFPPATRALRYGHDRRQPAMVKCAITWRTQEPSPCPSASEAET